MSFPKLILFWGLCFGVFFVVRWVLAFVRGGFKNG